MTGRDTEDRTRKRADAVLAARGFADSRARARAAIEAGGVTADGRRVNRPSDLIDPDAEITFQPAFAEVSRAAGKLKAAPGFDEARIKGAVVLDVGASTGGFTEVCLNRGAARVYAVDVGRGQLHPRLALLALWLSALAACSPFSPEIPLVITYRRSLLNEGYVVQLNNQSRRDLVVTVKLKSKDGRHKSETVAKLSAELTTEIGWLEGWRFDPGDSIRVIHPDFKDKTFEVP